MRLFAALLFVMTLAASAVASVGFVHQDSYTISAFTPSLSTTQIVRLDSAGSIGFLWHSGSEVRLYDPALDSVIFSHVCDTDEVLLSALVADISGDSSPDIVIASARNYLAYEPTEWRVTSFDGNSGYADSSFALFYSNTAPSAVTYMPVLSFLAARDLDQDGKAELVFSYSNVSGGQFIEYLDGSTAVFDRFPDTLLSTDLLLTTSIVSLTDMSGITRSFFQDYYKTFFDFAGGSSYSGSSLLLMKDYQHYTTVSPGCSALPCWGESNGAYCASQSLAVGDMVDGNVGDELLMLKVNQISCSDSGGHITVSELILASLTVGTTTIELQELWTIPYPSQFSGVGNFMVHPNLPGYFFGIAGDTLFMFRGENGAIRYQTSDIPHGQRYWETNWPDSIPRLVVMNGNQVDIYSLDIATAVEDNPPTSLPNQFTLGRPYPNPFNAETTIPIKLPTHCRLRLDVYNLLGERVATLADREFPAGEASITWDATGYSSGVYLVRADFGEQSETRKLILLK